ncbi:thiamine pyrophosphate-dependent enzyme [Thioalkalicoccus limnaeus]|uniref:Thiamine pyrophosphate-dependent enzyme n=1 Tax=Thioalkalicoccus limnaeus TaxID=120681 RepID=A0ABV4BGF3_9GAMM
MSTSILKVNPFFDDVMPQEYLELAENGPFDAGKRVRDLGTFKELIEEHPLCAGCNLALAFRLVVASVPVPEDTIFVGSTGCSSLAFSQLGLHNIHSLFGNQNAVASGLKRALQIRFPDRTKDVIVMAGDGATADIGLDITLHSWFRGEKITTVMFDNELYANTGGQESGMSQVGSVLNMAPTGKKFRKIDLPELARVSGCAYVAKVSVARPQVVGRSLRKAVLVARAIGPTYVQVHTPCPTNLKMKPCDGIQEAEERLKTDYAFLEFISPDAEKFLQTAETRSSRPAEEKV